MPIRTRLISLAVVAAALVVPASALARTTKVVPFKTVAGIPLQQTPQQVVKELGRPSHTIRVSGKIAEYDYSKLALTVQFDTLHHPIESDFVGVAVGFATPDIHYHTVHGIKIGSTRAQVKKAFGSRCRFHSGGCTVYSGTPGATGSSSFNIQLEQGKVEEFDNQIVLKDF
jgi:hypothetical protein